MPGVGPAADVLPSTSRMGVPFVWRQKDPSKGRALRDALCKVPPRSATLYEANTEGGRRANSHGSNRARQFVQMFASGAVRQASDHKRTVHAWDLLGGRPCLHTYCQPTFNIPAGSEWFTVLCGLLGGVCTARMDGTCLLDAGVSPPRDEPLLFR